MMIDWRDYRKEILDFEETVDEAILERISEVPIEAIAQYFGDSTMVNWIKGTLDIKA